MYELLSWVVYKHCIHLSRRCTLFRCRLNGEVRSYHKWSLETFVDNMYVNVSELVGLVIQSCLPVTGLLRTDVNITSEKGLEHHVCISTEFLSHGR